MRIIPGKMWASISILLSLSCNLFADGNVSIQERLVPGGNGQNAISEWSVNSSLGISSLSAIVFTPETFTLMPQIQPGGNLTVFPDLLNPSDLNRDSHFLFDTSSATILSQSETSSSMSTSVRFNANFPTSFKLAQVVYQSGPLFSGVSVTGTLVDRTPFDANAAIIPEPSVSALLLTAALALWLIRKRFLAVLFSRVS
jgi:hypothetical protein